MAGAVAVGACFGVALLFLLALFPPRAPLRWRRWRHVTRPLRRKLRPGHYRR